MVSLFGLSGMFVLIYFAIATINHGYPKYYMPALPLFAMVGAGYALREKRPEKADLAVILGSILFFTVYFFALTKDPIYLFRYKLREVLITGTGRAEFLKMAILQSAIYIIPFFAYFVFRRIGFKMLLLILVFSMSLSLSAKQAASKYQTNYSYGETGTLAVDEYLKKNAQKSDRIIATKDVLYRLGREESFFSIYFWKDKNKFLETLRRENTKFLVISIPAQSVAFYKNVMGDPAVKVFLERDFREIRLGTYTVYERK
jgi:hypothetical protein